MLNQFVVVGRIRELTQGEKGKVVIVIDIPRSFKNESGEYDIDTLPFEVFGGMATSTIENCEIKNIVGIKGRIQTNTENTIKLVAEKVTFLSSSKSNK